MAFVQLTYRPSLLDCHSLHDCHAPRDHLRDVMGETSN